MPLNRWGSKNNCVSRNRKRLGWGFRLLMLAASFEGATLSAAPSLSAGFTAAAPGTTATVIVNYTTDTNAATMQFDLLYATNYLVSGTPARGNALSDHQLASSEPSPGVR